MDENTRDIFYYVTSTATNFYVYCNFRKKHSSFFIVYVYTVMVPIYHIGIEQLFKSPCLNIYTTRRDHIGRIIDLGEK